MSAPTLRSPGPASPGTTAWVVSARHRSSAAVKPPEPFGSWHARRPGDPFTACGLPAAGWPLFWHLNLVQGRDRTCVECQRRLHELRDAGRQGEPVRG